MSYESNEYDDLVLAGLLHDIGKFYQRADSSQPPLYKNDKTDYGYSGAHSKWSSQFIIDYFGKDNEINNLVLYHHKKSLYKNDENLINIITKADSSSAYEREKSDEEQDAYNEPLISIFSEVELNDIQTKKHYMNLVPLNLDNYDLLYPIKEKPSMNNYNRLWEDFKNEFVKIKNLNDITTILSILKKYTTTVPSAIYKSEPDVSLYDHLKTTAAIATARYNYLLQHKKITKTSDIKENYIVINCSISGIQKFIYKINSPSNAQRGMAKRLRGRSFYLSLLMDTISQYMIKKLNLTECNIIFSSGGKFTILADNSHKTLQTITEIQDKINRLLINWFNAELYFSMVYTTCTDGDFKDFGKITSKLAQLTNVDKNTKFINQLDTIFKTEDDVRYDNICSVCGNLTEKNICQVCEEHQKLGTRLANAEYMIRYYSNKKDKSTDTYFKDLSIGYKFLDNAVNIVKIIKELSNTCEHVDVLKINDTNFLDLTSKIQSNNVSFSFKFIGNNIPSYDNTNITFEEIASKSHGANRLSVAKMDVDNLGLIFAKGLDNASISRVSSLSLYLDIFFAGIINKLAEKYDIYITYSGGDDLLVIGAYDKIIEFSMRLKEEFKNYTCNHDAITISSGISIVRSKFPISKAIHYADDNLEKSKTLGKNKITLFNQTVKWNTQDKLNNHINEKIYGLDRIMEFSNEMEKYVQDKRLSKGFIYSLSMLYNQYFEEINVLNEVEYEKKYSLAVKNKKYIPLFKYKLRTLKSDKELFKFADEEFSKNCYMPWIKIIQNWVLLRTR
ncbi:MAG: type III-A CRISPR-associated protein Cas10/Csm1 [Methanosphaera sp.]|nr:type III-A CRISPR-associated protein Cas10/Csm1 [Methanosphaera sp.]